MMFKQQLKSEAVLQQHSIAENAWKNEAITFLHFKTDSSLWLIPF